MRIGRILLLALLLISQMTYARPKDVRETDLRKKDDWSSFEDLMAVAREQEKVQGVSYLISGGLVTLGGLYGASRTSEPTTKLIFGMTQTLGILGMGYGAAKLAYGNEYSSLYDALRSSTLTPMQKNEILRAYLISEREKEKMINRIKMGTAFLLAAVNLAAASTETDPNTKAFFQVFAVANFAWGISLAF